MSKDIKQKWIAEERCKLLEDLAVMAIVSAVVIAGLIFFELIIKPSIFS